MIGRIWLGGIQLINILSSIITAFIAVPLLGFIIIFAISKVMTHNPRKAVHHALDFSTILFIVSVHFLIVTIWGKSLLWLIILAMILFAMVFSIIHWKVKGEIVFSSLFKGFWRFNFLFFFFAYCLLTFFGLLDRALTFTFFS